MTAAFAELDYRDTPLGTLSLRKRCVPELDGAEVFEVKLGEDFLMSSLFHEVEVALADLGIERLETNPVDVVVGGLGLGYTAVAALKHTCVSSLLVVDFLQPVIEWHQQGLVPLGQHITSDPRCRLVHGDFFALATDPLLGFDPLSPGRRFDAILLDIDHSPRNLLHPRHAEFYTPTGLARMASQLHSGGVFALWSDDAPDSEFLALLGTAFTNPEARVVKFFNPILERSSASTVYLASKA